jgi:hypothetical protein
MKQAGRMTWALAMKDYIAGTEDNREVISVIKVANSTLSISNLYVLP